MFYKTVSVILLGFLLFTSCKWNVYELEMRTEGDSLERKFSCYEEWGGGSGEEPKRSRSNQQELDRIKFQYDSPPSFPDEYRTTFQGLFEDETPQDIGGAGRFKRFESSMGSVFGYMERFRGADDQAGRLEEMLNSVDRLMNLVRDFLETKFEDLPDWDALRACMDLDFRRDAKNLLVYFWLASAMAEDLRGDRTEFMEDFLSRFLLYLAERDYIELKRIPELSRQIHDWIEVPSNKEILFIAECLSRKLKVSADSPLLEALVALLATDDLEESLHDYIRTLPEWEIRVKRYEAEREENPEANEPHPREYVDDISEGLFAFGIEFTKSCRIQVRFAAPGEPLHTNGEWNVERKEVHWTGEMWSDENLPAFAYAVWAEPEEAFQRARFGRVVLKDQDLLEYVF